MKRLKYILNGLIALHFPGDGMTHCGMVSFPQGASRTAELMLARTDAPWDLTCA